jgi:hypothetical protein
MRSTSTSQGRWRVYVSDQLPDGSSVATLVTYQKSGTSYSCRNGVITPDSLRCDSNKYVGLVAGGDASWRIKARAGADTFYIISLARQACSNKPRYLAASSSCDDASVTMRSSTGSVAEWYLERVGGAPAPPAPRPSPSPPPPVEPVPSPPPPTASPPPPPPAALTPAAPAIFAPGTSAASPTTATVTWVAGAPGAGPILGFKVVCTNTATGASPGSQTFAGQFTLTTGPGGYTGLTPASQYACRVAAYNVYGDGPLSAPSSAFVTPAAPVSSPPPPPPPVVVNPTGVPPVPTIAYTPTIGVLAQLTVTPGAPLLGGTPACITSIKTLCVATGSPLAETFPQVGCPTAPFNVQAAGLASGQSYTCYAQACNAFAPGTGDAQCSVPSSSVTFTYQPLVGR